MYNLQYNLPTELHCTTYNKTYPTALYNLKLNLPHCTVQPLIKLTPLHCTTYNKTYPTALYNLQ